MVDDNSNTRPSRMWLLALVACFPGVIGTPALPVNMTCFNTIALVVGGTGPQSRPGENVTGEPTATVKVRA